MKRRREHIECENKEGGRGCIILGTPICKSKKKQAPWAVMKGWILRFATLYIAFCFFVFVAIAAIGIQTAGTVVDVGAYLTPISIPGTSP